MKPTSQQVAAALRVLVEAYGGDAPVWLRESDLSTIRNCCCVINDDYKAAAVLILTVAIAGEIGGYAL